MVVRNVWLTVVPGKTVVTVVPSSVEVTVTGGWIEIETIVVVMS